MKKRIIGLALALILATNAGIITPGPIGGGDSIHELPSEY